MALWKKVRQLDSPSLAEIVSIYASQSIPIEVRDYFSLWMESSIKHLNPVGFVTGLSLQIQEKLGSVSMSMSNLNDGGMGEAAAPTPFYIIQKLAEFQVVLTSVQSEGPAQELHGRFLTCLEKERAIINRRGLGSSPLPSWSPACVVPPPSTGSPPSQQVFQDNFLNFQNEQFPMPNGYQQQSSNEDVVDASANVETYNPNDFLNNEVRIRMDGDMSHIFDVVWGLEENSNLFSIKCHELRRHQDLFNQQNRITGQNGIQKSFEELRNIQAKIVEAKKEVLGIVSKIYGKTTEIRNRSENVLSNWTQLKLELDNDLLQWRVEQKAYANGRPMSMTLNKSQHVSEYLMDVAWKLRHYLSSTDRIRQANSSIFTDDNQNGRGPSHDIPVQLARITSLIKQLVQDTFVVAHQPIQVLKTNTRIHIAPGKSSMEVRLLVGDKLSLQLSPPMVIVSIIDEKTARDIDNKGLEGNSFKNVPKKGRLMPETGGACLKRLEHNPDTGSFAAVFRQVSLKDIYRNGRRHNLGKDPQQGGEFVTEEKLCLLFRAEFSAGDMQFQVWRKSLPIVVITHGSQESPAWAAVTWDNQFSLVNRVQFEVPEVMDWDAIRDMLNTKFSSMVGAPLSEENLSYFAEKVSIFPGYPNNLSWSDLCKVTYPGRKFTFWDWFYEGAKFIEQHMKQAWKDGHIKGFIGKETSENLLCQSGSPPGTFLFRFSDSVLGGISIMWLHSDGKAYSQSPFRTKELAGQPLVEKMNQEYLLYVYPNVRKELAFQEYYEEYKSSMERKDSEKIAGKPDYVKLRTQLIIDSPDIPTFCLKDNSRRTDDYAIIQGNQDTPSTNEDSWNGNCDNVIEIDIDKIIGELNSPGSYNDYYNSNAMSSSPYSQSSSYYMSPANSFSNGEGDSSGNNAWAAPTQVETGGIVASGGVSGGQFQSYVTSSPSLSPPQLEESFYMEL